MVTTRIIRATNSTKIKLKFRSKRSPTLRSALESKTIRSKHRHRTTIERTRKYEKEKKKTLRLLREEKRREGRRGV